MDPELVFLKLGRSGVEGISAAGGEPRHLSPEWAKPGRAQRVRTGVDALIRPFDASALVVGLFGFRAEPRRFRAATRWWWSAVLGFSARRKRGAGMAKVEVKARHDGPYKVTGPVRLIDADGNEYDLGGRGETIALCRCGGSTTKPFCDGTHSKIGFQAAERAVAKSEGG